MLAKIVINNGMQEKKWGLFHGQEITSKLQNQEIAMNKLLRNMEINN